MKLFQQPSAYSIAVACSSEHASTVTVVAECNSTSTCARFPVHQYTTSVPSKRSKFSEVTFDFTLNEQRLGTRETRSQLSKWRDEPRATSQKFTELAEASKFDSMGSTKDVCDDVRISRRATGIVVRSRDRELDGRAPRLKLATSWRETTSFDFVSARFSFLSCYEVAGP